MHELSVAHAVVRTVSNAVPGRRVTRVTLHVGVASGVAPEALAFAWDVAVTGTPLSGARLDVVRVPLTVTCRACGETTDATRPRHVRCGTCDGRAVDVVGGRELLIDSVEVEDPAEAAEPAEHWSRGWQE